VCSVVEVIEDEWRCMTWNRCKISGVLLSSVDSGELSRALRSERWLLSVEMRSWLRRELNWGGRGD
jgi:hypothetical protein